MRAYHQVGSIVGLLLLLLGPLGGSASAQPAQPGQSGRELAAQNGPETLSGVFEIMWGDPGAGQRGQPVADYVLAGDNGQTTQLELAGDVARAAGGALALAKKQVIVTGERVNSRKVKVKSIKRAKKAKDEPRAELALAADPVAGNQPWVNIMCRFLDATTVTPTDPSYVRGLFSTTQPGLDHYWREVSFNTFNVANSLAVGWYNLPRTRESYIGPDGLLFQDLVDDCTAAADAEVVFPNYAGINLMFNQDLNGYAWGGSSTITRDGQTKSFATTWLPPWGYQNQSVMVHEMGHGFGLPHSSGPYSETYDSQWDPMSSPWRCTPADPVYSCVAAHMTSFNKDRLGAIPPSRKYVAAPLSTQSITLERLGLPVSGTNYLMAQIPIGSSGTQFYTVEARRFAGYDTQLPGEAVIIHKVDTTLGDRLAQVVDGDANGDPNDAGAMWLPGETFTDAANSISVAVTGSSATSFAVTIQAGPTSSCPDTAFEPDDTPAQARAFTLGTTETHTFCVTNDADWVSFQATAGAAYRIETLNLAATNDTVLELYAGNGTTLLALDDDGNGGAASVITYTTPTAGVYYVKARQYYGTGGNDLLYDLRITADSCRTSSTAWQSSPLAAQTGSFAVTFDATPASAPMDGVIGLSAGAATAYSSLATTARFNPSGRIDARNGGSYQAATAIAYTAGTSYHFRMTVRVPSHTYDLYVTPAGGAEQVVGTNYAFRTEQSTVASLGSWSLYAATASHRVCNLTVTPIAQPAPTLTGVSPATGSTAGGTAVTLSGTNFQTGATVSFGGVAATGVGVTATSITATTPARVAGAVAVSVTNPDGQSATLPNAYTYLSDNPVPTASSLSPSTATAGGTAFTLTVDGASFVASSTVRWNGSARPTTFVSSTRLTAAIAAADIAAAGTASVSVFTPTPGGGTSNALPFTITGGGGNLALNPSFELDANGDGRPDTWTSNSRFTRSAEIAAVDGSYVGRFRATDNSGTTISETVNGLAANAAYSVSSRVNIPATSDAFTFRIEVRWRNASSSTLRTDTVKSYTGATGGWNTAAAALTSPAGTTSAQIRMVVSSLNATIYVDGFVLSSGAPPVDTTPPAVQSTSPAAGATGVAVGANIGATFSEPVSGVSTTSFTLKPQGGAALPATVTYDAATRTATLNPSADLLPGTSYEAALTGTIKDAANNALVPVSWTFATGGGSDTTPPAVQSTTPAAGATNVAIGANVGATFSEAVAGVSTSTFTLKPQGGTAIAAAVTYDAATRTATLNPNADLLPATVYEAGLTSGIKDAANNALLPVSWTFTTAPTTGGITATFGPTADTYVSQASATTSYASASSVSIVGGTSSAKQAFIRFNVTGLPAGATIQSAKLRLTVTNDSTSGGQFYRISNTSWAETITWNTRPTIDGPQLATLGTAALNAIVEVDVTATITGNGAYSFAITLPDSNGNTLGYASREASTATNRPQLVVTTR